MDTKLEILRAPMLIGGEWILSDNEYEVADPYHGTPYSRAPKSSLEDLDRALNAAVAAKTRAAALPPYERAKLLRAAAKLVGERADLLAEIMARETGKPLSDCKVEVTRAPDTLNFSAEEAVRIEGEQVPVDGTPLGLGKLAILLRFPLGVVAAITPYNAPVNLICHKVGPAIAAGNVVVLKAPPQCPYLVYKLIECFVDAGFPPGYINVLYGDEVGPALVKDRRVDFITFTGSDKVGAQIKAASGLRRVALELGGIGPTIIHSDADLDACAPITTRNAFRIAGQSCVSVQNVFVHADLYDRFVEIAVKEVNAYKIGDPLEKGTDIGPMISEQAAMRVERTVNEAVANGAKALTGGKRRGNIYEPTILVDVDVSMNVVCQEIFGPVMTVRSYTDLGPVIQEISDSHLGLQGGIFTKSLEVAMRVARTMRVGGIIINGTSTWRTDQSAYGGVKDSGIGREGPKYAIREMTEERLVVFNL
jgi:acyl-CoA reductase-like NAD-dependent aldehyde dehydrogenase